jgi:hypothetical protein
MLHPVLGSSGISISTWCCARTFIIGWSDIKPALSKVDIQQFFAPLAPPFPPGCRCQAFFTAFKVNIKQGSNFPTPTITFLRIPFKLGLSQDLANS